MKLCTYIVTNDTGLAPNPFWGYCTLAVCTPNHQGAKLEPRNWIAGFLSKSRGHRLLYAMEIDEVLDLHDYYNDPRFYEKKPTLQGDWVERCGDNFYSRDSSGNWKQHRNRFHIGPKILKKDTRHPNMFIASRFWYFGQEAQPLPKPYEQLVGGRGIRVNHPPAVVRDFCGWIATTYQPGIHGDPIDNPDL